MLLKLEKSREYDKECSREWLVNTDPGILPAITKYATKQ